MLGKTPFLVVITAGLLFFLCSCRGKEYFVRKSPISWIGEYPDSSFIGDVKCLQIDNGRLFLLDINRRSVISLSLVFSDFKTISIGGRGPGELIAPYSFFVDGDSVHVVDFGPREVKSYNKGIISKKTPFANQVRDCRFVKSEGIFYLPYKSDDISVVRMIPGKELFPLLGTENFSSPVKTATMNSCNILAYGDLLVVVPEALPYVKIVDKSGEVLKTIELGQSYSYNKNYSYSHNTDLLEKTCIILNHDACIFGNTLFVLVPKYGENYECNRIITVDLATGIISEKIMVLEGINYTSICVSGSRLYAFNKGENQLEVYEL